MIGKNGKKSYAGGGAAWPVIAIVFALVLCVIVTSPIWVRMLLK